MGRVVVPEQIEKIASDAIDAALAVHRALGPGLLESAYRECLNLELTARGHRIESEQLLPITYRGHVVSNAYRTDLLVDRQLLIELKAIEAIQPVHRVQLTTYLRLSRLPLGLLVNFNAPLLKEGLHRVLNLDFQAPLRESSPTSRLRA